jgi:hypothetical protein
MAKMDPNAADAALAVWNGTVQFFKYKGPRIAWIGNPPQQSCMVEVGTWSFPAKVHPEKKPQSKKLDGK